jgi:hypothetical protein
VSSGYRETESMGVRIAEERKEYDGASKSISKRDAISSFESNLDDLSNKMDSNRYCI